MKIHFYRFWNPILGLGACLLSSLLLAEAPAENASSANFSAQLRLYSMIAPDDHQAVRIGTGDSVGVRFQAESPFQAVQFCCPSYGNAVGALTISLYGWHESVEQTRAQTPAASERFTDFPDNSWLALRFPMLPAGEYYCELTDSSETVGVWKRPGTFAGATSYFNTEPMEGCCEIGLEVTGTSIPFAGTWELYRKLTAETLAPPETDCVSDENGSLLNQPFTPRDLFADTWDAVDGLGRKLGTSNSLGTPREKQVGIFYWTWHEGSGTTHGPNNNVKILAENPGIENRPDDPKWGNAYARHHWDEPVFGYYRTTDAWVLRRHAQMLSEAGVDAVIFDATNGTWTWMDSTWALLKTWEAMRQDGLRTPKFAFMLPFGIQPHQRDSLLQLYREIYRPGRFRDQWLYWNGRPLVHANPTVIEMATRDAARSEEDRKDWEEILRFFTFRPLQPTYASGPQNPEQWCWLEVFPQHGYGQRADGTFEMCAAGIAQNHSWETADGRKGIAAMNDQNVFGRAYVGPAEEELQPGEKLRFAPDRNPKRNEPNRFLWGENFAQQLDQAQKLDPDYLFITGWNEWTASLFPKWMGKKTAFPDQFSPGFSRDAEPSAGILKDHFYYQLVQGIRRFRGVHPQRAADENPIYRDALHDTLPRSAAGYGSTCYQDSTGRNDLAECFVRHDAETVTFTAECSEPLTPSSDPNWMQLLISVSLEDEAQPHWEHFQFLVNRKPPQEGLALLERCSQNGWHWEEIARVPMRVEGNRLEITIPRSLLGQADQKLDLRFKWTDNVWESGKEGEILDLYRHGDAAPDGRFLYRYFEK